MWDLFHANIVDRNKLNVNEDIFFRLFYFSQRWHRLNRIVYSRIVRFLHVRVLF